MAESDSAGNDEPQVQEQPVAAKVLLSGSGGGGIRDRVGVGGSGDDVDWWHLLICVIIVVWS